MQSLLIVVYGPGTLLDLENTIVTIPMETNKNIYLCILIEIEIYRYRYYKLNTLGDKKKIL